MRKTCCDMRGMLSFLMLFLLSKKSMNGQEIAKEIEKRKGIKPSPGTIYPALRALKDNRWIVEVEKGKAIEYKLTEEGKRVFGFARKQFCKIFLDVI